MSTVSSKQTTPSAEHSSSSKVTWSPWFAVVFIVVIYYVVQVIGSLVVSIYPALQHWSQARAQAWLTSSVWGQFFYILIAEGLAAGAIYVFLRRRKIGVSVIGLRRPRLSDPLWGLAMLVPYFVSYMIIVGVAHALIPALNVSQQQQIGFEHAHGAGNLVLIFVSLVILPPLVEEIMFRGFLYTSLKKSLRTLWAALITCVIFASAHLQIGSGAPLLWIAFIDTFILSSFLVYLREKTGGLYASMTLHALKNVVAFASIFIFHLT